jgi:hypothetical protein
MSYSPYSTVHLNRTQNCFLFVNVFTLFVGIMLVNSGYEEDASVQAGDKYNSSQRDVISLILFLSNIFVLGFPLALLLTGPEVLEKVKGIQDSLCGNEKIANEISIVNDTSNFVTVAPMMQIPAMIHVEDTEIHRAAGDIGLSMQNNLSDICFETKLPDLGQFDAWGVASEYDGLRGWNQVDQMNFYPA